MLAVVLILTLLHTGPGEAMAVAPPAAMASHAESDPAAHEAALIAQAHALYAQSRTWPQARALLQSHTFTQHDYATQAQGLLGRDYLTGWGGQPDEDLGAQMLDQAIADGFNDPVLLEGYALYWLDTYGHDRAHHDRIAELLYIAGEAGSTGALWQLGMFILNTGGDDAEAYDLVARSADQGFVQGMASRAALLAAGQGVEQDLPAARRWYLEAVRRYSADAMTSYGAMLVSGTGGAADPALGFGLLDIAAGIEGHDADETRQWLLIYGYERPDEARIQAALEAFLQAEGLDPAQFR